MTTLSDQLRDELSATIGPCGSCGRPRGTIAGLAAELKVPPSTLGKYLGGGKPTVALLDAADAFLDPVRQAAKRLRLQPVNGQVVLYPAPITVPEALEQLGIDPEALVAPELGGEG